MSEIFSIIFQQSLVIFPIMIKMLFSSLKSSETLFLITYILSFACFIDFDGMSMCLELFYA